MDDKGKQEADRKKDEERVLGLFDLHTAEKSYFGLRCGGFGRADIRALVKGLKDPRCRTMVYPKGLEPEYNQTAFDALCRFLDDRDLDAEVLEILAGFANDPSPAVRKNAVGLLAKSGKARWAEWVIRAMGDKGESVAWYALFGVHQAILKKRMEPTCAMAVRDRIAGLLVEECEPVISEYAPKTMMMIDEGWALKVLLSEGVLSAKNPNVGEILSVLNRAEAKVERARVMEILNSVQGRKDQGVYYLIYVACLLALARDPDEESRMLLTRCLSDANNGVRHYARMAHAIMKGLDQDPAAGLVEMAREKRLEELSAEQRMIVAVRFYDVGVYSGGHLNYMDLRSSWAADKYRLARQGMRLIGANEFEDVLLKAVDVIAASGLDVEVDEQADGGEESMTARKQAIEALEALDETYHTLGSKKSLSVYVFEYALANPGLFPKARHRE